MPQDKAKLIDKATVALRSRRVYIVSRLEKVRQELRDITARRKLLADQVRSNPTAPEIRNVRQERDYLGQDIERLKNELSTLTSELGPIQKNLKGAAALSKTK